MQLTSLSISDKKVDFYFGASVSLLDKLVSKNNTILLTDQVVFSKFPAIFHGWETIVINSGESSKQQDTINDIIQQLVNKEADKSTWLIGIGGGVITDITGYAAGIYMRGMHTGFVPTSILAMVDASVGGKNGINWGSFKNIIGITKQPSFIIYDYSLLESLPTNEWENGFAEIIKHACIRDKHMFDELENRSIFYYQKNPFALATLIEKNVQIKTSIVNRDAMEEGERKLLNFGHTLGHAIEAEYQIAHGHAISIGMMAASFLSTHYLGFSEQESLRLKNVLEQYQLPTQYSFDKHLVMNRIKMDKKKRGSAIHFVFLEKIGIGAIREIQIEELHQWIHNWEY